MAYFLKLLMCVYLRTKFQASNIILTSFRQGTILPLPLPQNETLKSPPRLGLQFTKWKQLIYIFFALSKKNI